MSNDKADLTKKDATISPTNDLFTIVELSEDELKRVAGGKPQKADASLDAGVHFKYDLNAQKEA